MAAKREISLLWGWKRETSERTVGTAASWDTERRGGSKRVIRNQQEEKTEGQKRERPNTSPLSQ